MKIVKTNDSKGNTYYKLFGSTTRMVASIGRDNVEYDGIPKLNYRIGNSGFGEEIFFEFEVKKRVKVYPTNSKYDTIEFYFTPKMFFVMVDELKKVVGVTRK